MLWDLANLRQLETDELINIRSMSRFEDQFGDQIIAHNFHLNRNVEMIANEKGDCTQLMWLTHVSIVDGVRFRERLNQNQQHCIHIDQQKG